MPIQQPIFNNHEKRIIIILRKYQRGMTITEISTRVKDIISNDPNIGSRECMAWKTAKDNLKILKDKGVVESKKIGSKTYWKLKYT
jgi:hypothetical protein